MHFVRYIQEMFVKMEDIKQPIIKNISFDRSKLYESDVIEL